MRHIKNSLVLMAAAYVLLPGTLHGELSDKDIVELKARGQAEGWTFTVGKNSTTDFSLEQLCGFVEPANWGQNANSNPCTPVGQPPSYFDWRELDGCTPIRSQGGCGSCWAFAAVGVVECNILIKDFVQEDLSEQWLVSCSDAGTCAGGDWYSALGYFLSTPDHCNEIGPVLEADFPYQAADVTCQCPYPHQEKYLIDARAFIGSGPPETPSIEQIKQAIMDYGPVAVAVAADAPFQAYTGGIFNACTSDPTNHAVVLVGWDDDQGANGVWFLRNSWGTGWGESGYMRIEYGCSSIGYGASYADYPGCTPDPPATVNAQTGAGCGDVVLTWSTALRATGYRIFYDEESTVPPFLPDRDGNPSSGSDVGDVTEVTITGLTPGQRYYLAVTAYNDIGESDYSGVVSTVTGTAGSFALTTNVPGGHGEVVTDPAGPDYACATVVTLTAEPDTCYRVKAWSGTDDDTSTEITNTVTMESDKVVTVEFEPIPYTLTASVAGGGGTISADPAGPTYDCGTVVTLTATPDTCYRVKGWSGTDDDTSTGTTNTVTMDSDKTVTVQFEIIPYTLGATVVGEGGSISADPAGPTYDCGTVVTLTAAPDHCYQVKAWTGTDDDSSTGNTNTVTMGSDKNVTVEFELIPYTLDASVVGANGTISVDPVGPSYDSTTAERWLR